MPWIDSIISAVSPSWGLRRHIARQRFERLRTETNRLSNRNVFEATSGSRTRYDFLSTTSSADTAIRDGSAGVRNRVRQLEYNTGFVSGPIRRIVNNVVGSGIRFQSRVKSDEKTPNAFPRITSEMAERFNAQVEFAFEQWARHADIRFVRSFYAVQRIVMGALIRDGEVLVVGRNSARKNRYVPYCLEVFEIDRLATPPEFISNANVRNGIRFDSEGVPEAYYVRKVHPGETLNVSNLGLSQLDYEEIPAWNENGTQKVLHIFDPIRPEQTRGYSVLASALKDFDDLDRYREAEILAALEDACLTGFVKSEQAYDWQSNYTTDTGENSERIHEFAPNKWHYLKPGEDISIHAPARPNEQLAVMTAHLLNGPSNALDCPPEVLFNDWKGMNYSNARTVLLQFYLSCRIRQQLLKDQFCVPVYENVLSDLVAWGKVRADGYNVRPEAYRQHVWIAPGWSWVDPVKEVQGKALEVANNFSTLTAVCASTGDDIDDVLETRARELAKIQELEEKYQVVFPASDVVGGSYQEEQPEDQDTENMEEEAVQNG